MHRGAVAQPARQLALHVLQAKIRTGRGELGWQAGRAAVCTLIPAEQPVRQADLSAPGQLGVCLGGMATKKAPQPHRRPEATITPDDGTKK